MNNNQFKLILPNHLYYIYQCIKFDEYQIKDTTSREKKNIFEESHVASFDFI